VGTSALALLVGLTGVLLFFGLPTNEQHTAQPRSVAFLPFLVPSAGAVLYAAGTAIWHSTLGFALRLFGWILMVVLFLLPSQLVLALPVIALLVVTLYHVPEHARRSARRAGISEAEEQHGAV